MADFDEVFAFTIELEFPPTQRAFVARGDPRLVTKNAAEHGSEFPRQFFASAKVAANPGGAGFEGFVVVTGFEVKEATISGNRGLSVIAAVVDEITMNGS